MCTSYPSFNELQAYYNEYPFFVEVATQEEVEQYAKFVMEEEVFWEIKSRFSQLEHDLACSARTAILMAAIDVEACVNRFCYYNLGEDATNAIERLNLSEKLTVIHRVLGLGDFKGTSQYKAVKGLGKWRNAFAHGKCTDMPTCSLKDNHLSEPKNRPSSRSTVNEVLKLLQYYVVICLHLDEINTHPHTNIGYYRDLDSVKFLLEDVQGFKFKDDLIVEKTNW